MTCNTREAFLLVQLSIDSMNFGAPHQSASLEGCLNGQRGTEWGEHSHIAWHFVFITLPAVKKGSTMDCISQSAVVKSQAFVVVVCICEKLALQQLVVWVSSSAPASLTFTSSSSSTDLKSKLALALWIPHTLPYSISPQTGKLPHPGYQLRDLWLRAITVGHGSRELVLNVVQHSASIYLCFVW